MKRTSGRSAATATEGKARAQSRTTITDEALDTFFAATTSGNAAIAAALPAPTPSQAQADVDDLFAEVITAPPLPTLAPPAPLRNCAVCGGKDGLRAHPEHAVCLDCATDPGKAAKRLETQRRMVVNQQRQAAHEAQSAYDAMTEDERERWGRYALLRARYDSGDALTDQETKALMATKSAYVATSHPRITPAMRHYYLLDECLFWANETNQARQKQINVQLATLGLCLEDLGRKPEADALYPKEPTP